MEEEEIQRSKKRVRMEEQWRKDKNGADSTEETDDIIETTKSKQDQEIMKTGGMISYTQIIPIGGYTSLMLEQIRNSQEGPTYTNYVETFDASNLRVHYSSYGKENDSNEETRQKQEAMSNSQYDIQNWESFVCQGEPKTDMNFMEMYEGPIGSFMHMVEAPEEFDHVSENSMSQQADVMNTQQQ